jgi:hypothetical protein
VLNRVIIIRNIQFDEDILYTLDQEKVVGQLLKII